MIGPVSVADVAGRPARQAGHRGSARAGLRMPASPRAVETVSAKGPAPLGGPPPAGGSRLTSLVAPTGHFVAAEALAWFLATLGDFLGG